MTFHSLFLALAFAVAFVSSRPSLFNGNSTAWDNPEFVAAYPDLYNRVIEGEQKYDPALVINVMRSRTRNLKIITAHRGVSSPGCPENSICAVDATIAAGIESVEIDVRNDKDGNLWPIHDQRIGRVTNYSLPGQPPFDPYHDKADSPSNPLIADLSTADFSNLWTRDNNQKICDQFVTLEEILQHIKANGHLAVMLDVKSKDAIQSTANMIRNLGMTASAGVKFLDTLLNPSSSTDMAILDGVNFVPVQFATAQDIIASKGSWWKTAWEVVLEYDILYLKHKNILNFEPSNKMWEYWGPWGWLPQGPGKVMVKYLSPKISLGTFVPTTDVEQGYFSSDGTCCLQLNQFLAKTKYFSSESRDDRLKVDAMIMTHDILIADDVSEVYEYANRWGYRKGIKNILGRS